MDLFRKKKVVPLTVGEILDLPEDEVAVTNRTSIASMGRERLVYLQVMTHSFFGDREDINEWDPVRVATRSGRYAVGPIAEDGIRLAAKAVNYLEPAPINFEHYVNLVRTRPAVYDALAVTSNLVRGAPAVALIVVKLKPKKQSLTIKLLAGSDEYMILLLEFICVYAAKHSNYVRYIKVRTQYLGTQYDEFLRLGFQYDPESHKMVLDTERVTGFNLANGSLFDPENLD